MAQTTPREALTCLAFSYFASKGSGANIEDFSNVVYDYYFNDNISELNKWSGAKNEVRIRIPV